ncbi:MAG: hypothetical protein HY960_07375 [Ignavibacteriae bacterium]|nr:hypothetical protein [Ignavibacteriota bacterium]
MIKIRLKNIDVLNQLRIRKQNRIDLAFLLFSIFIVLPLLSVNCNRKNGNFNKVQVINICRTYLQSISPFNDVNEIIKLEPEHPITLDSIKQKKVITSYRETDLELIEASHGKLLNKSFWRCTVSSRELVLDSDKEVFIDAVSGEILYIFPLGTPEEIQKRQQNR